MLTEENSRPERIESSEHLLECYEFVHERAEALNAPLAPTRWMATSSRATPSCRIQRARMFVTDRNFIPAHARRPAGGIRIARLGAN